MYINLIIVKIAILRAYLVKKTVKNIEPFDSVCDYWTFYCVQIVSDLCQ